MTRSRDEVANAWSNHLSQEGKLRGTHLSQCLKSTIDSVKDISKSYVQTFEQQGLPGRLAMGTATVFTVNLGASAACKFAEIPSILFGYGSHGRPQYIVSAAPQQGFAGCTTNTRVGASSWL